MTIQLQGSVSVKVHRPDAAEEIETIDAKDFGLEEGGEAEQDSDGDWSCGAIFVAFMDGYALELSVSFIGSHMRDYSLEVRDTDEDTVATIAEDDLICEVSYPA